MSIISGSAKYRNFNVSFGEDGKGFSDVSLSWLTKSINERAFKELVFSEDNEYSSGWAHFSDPFNNEAKLSSNEYMFGDMILLAHRTDTWNIPKTAINKAAKKKLDEIAEREGVTPGELKKGLVKEIKKNVTMSLKKGAIPKSSIIQVMYNTETSKLRIFGTGKATESVAAMFERTFKCRLEVVDFQQMLIDAGKSNVDVDVNVIHSNIGFVL